jgi:SH3 domain protein
MNIPKNLLILILTIICAPLLADTVYVRDTLYVPLRGGQSTEHRILHRGLKSGTPLERLQQNEDTGYTNVRTEGGLEGWLQTQYLVETPSASTRLGDVLAQLEQLEADHQQTLLRLRESNELADDLRNNENTAVQNNADLSKELDQITGLASNVIAIDEENKALTKERRNLRNEIDSLNEQNSSLSDTRAQEWFLRGAGIVFIGLLLGFLIARRIYHNRNTSGWA